MPTLHRLSILLSPLLLVACATSPPFPKEFPAGARAPTANELTTVLRGKSYEAPLPNGGTIRTDYAADSNGIAVYVAGRSDSGTWRTEDGRICFQLKTLPSNCNEVRLVGSDFYMKRVNGDVVRVTPR